MGLSEDNVALLGELASALHQATLPADVVEERLAAVARRFGMAGEFFTLQSFVAMELHAEGATSVSLGRMSFDTHWNLTRMTALISLSDELADGRLAAAGGRRELRAIAARPNRYPSALVVAAYGVYGLAVAGRVGGGALELLVGAAVGLVAGTIHYGTLRSNTLDLQKSFLAALAGTVCAFLLALVLPPFDQSRALFGGITLLVPAMVVTVGVHELASEAVESGVARLAYGLLRFAMMAAGIDAAMKMVTWLGAWPASVTATPLSHLTTLALVGAGGVALIFCLQGPPRDAVAIVAAALLGYGAQELTKRLFGEEGAPMLSAFVLGAVAYLHARLSGRSTPVMIVPGLLQLAPGFLGTRVILHLLKPGESTVGAADGFLQVFVIALQLGIGLLIADLLFRRRRPTAVATLTAPP
jgi:uncharacterized membrane protein YjjP (DUF1212 family)